MCLKKTKAMKNLDEAQEQRAKSHKNTNLLKSSWPSATLGNGRTRGFKSSAVMRTAWQIDLLVKKSEKLLALPKMCGSWEDCERPDPNFHNLCSFHLFPSIFNFVYYLKISSLFIWQMTGRIFASLHECSLLQTCSFLCELRQTAQSKKLWTQAQSLSCYKHSFCTRLGCFKSKINDLSRLSLPRKGLKTAKILPTLQASLCFV